MSETQLQKELRIKSGAVKRTHKEYISYQKEEEQMQAKMLQYEAQGILDEYDMKKKRELLEETQSMLPNCQTRLQNVYNELNTWMEENGDSPDIFETEQKETAQAILNEAKEFLEQLNSQVGQDEE